MPRPDLYRRISDHIIEQFNDPVMRITEALLWRGFLVEKHDNEIHLYNERSHPEWCEEGSRPEADLILLQEILAEPRFQIHPPTDNNHPARISVPQVIDEDDILCIVSSGSQPVNAMTATVVPAEVRPLDIGVALMVKKLWLARVHTDLSCDGFDHGNNYPWISLQDQDNYDKCRNVIREATDQLRIANLGEFILHAGENQVPRAHYWQIADNGFDNQVEKAFQVFHKVQRVARHLKPPPPPPTIEEMRRLMSK